MGIMSVAVYRPLPGNEEQLMEIVKRHLPTLRAEELITEFPSFYMQAGDGSIIEVFEWASMETKQQAHHSPAVRALWKELIAAAEMAPLSSVDEATRPFSTFRLLNL